MDDVERIALGLDVSKLHIDACLLLKNGKKNKLKISNNRAGFMELLCFLDGLELSTIHACMEATGRYHRPLANLLHELGIKVSIVNSFTVQNHSRSKGIRNKTDSVDSFILADFCLMHAPRAWEPPQITNLELRDIQNRLINIAEMIRQEQNRLEAGIDSDVVRQDIDESLGRLLVAQRKLEKSAKQLISEVPALHEKFKILTSIIGVGDGSAIGILAFISFDKFSDGRKVGAYVGLAPEFYDSGTSIHARPKISKAGNAELRKALYFPAMSAMQHNPQLRSFAERLRSKNKPAKVIICAVMRKLLVLAAALVRKNQFYDPAYGM